MEVIIYEFFVNDKNSMKWNMNHDCIFYDDWKIQCIKKTKPLVLDVNSLCIYFSVEFPLITFDKNNVSQYF